MNYASATHLLQRLNFTPQILVTVTTNFAGFHKWPDAPQNVAFLRDLHRHLFGVRVTVEVTHSNRDVEFFTLKAQVDEYVRDILTVELSCNPAMSCEMMATILAAHLFNAGYAVVSVAVDEDGENEGMLVFKH